jgi:membrane-bound ClpP family serine protease
MKEVVIYRPDVLKRVGILGAIGVIVLIFFSIKAHYKDLNYQFNGRVDSVFYGEKATATVWVRKEEYYLDANNWDFDHNRIQKGDSLIKEKNSMVIRLIRPNGSVIVEGENYVIFSIYHLKHPVPPNPVEKILG